MSSSNNVLSDWVTEWPSDRVTKWPSNLVTGSFADDWPDGIFSLKYLWMNLGTYLALKMRFISIILSQKAASRCNEQVFSIILAALMTDFEVKHFKTTKKILQVDGGLQKTGYFVPAKRGEQLKQSYQGHTTPSICQIVRSTILGCLNWTCQVISRRQKIQ